MWATKSATNVILKTADNAPRPSSTGSRTGIAACAASWLIMKPQSSPDSQCPQWALSQKSSSAFQGGVSSCPSQVSYVISMMTHRSLFFWRYVAMYKSLCTHDLKLWVNPVAPIWRTTLLVCGQRQEQRMSKRHPTFSKSVLYIQEAEQEQKLRCTFRRYVQDGMPIVLNGVCFSMHMKIKVALSPSHLILSPFPVGIL